LITTMSTAPSIRSIPMNIPSISAESVTSARYRSAVTPASRTSWSAFSARAWLLA